MRFVIAVLLLLAGILPAQAQTAEAEVGLALLNNFKREVSVAAEKVGVPQPQIQLTSEGPEKSLLVDTKPNPALHEADWIVYVSVNYLRGQPLKRHAFAALRAACTMKESPHRDARFVEESDESIEICVFRYGDTTEYLDNLLEKMTFKEKRWVAGQSYDELEARLIQRYGEKVKKQEP